MTHAPDILIVGLGISGEAVARYYLEDDVPVGSVTVLDAHDGADVRERSDALVAAGARVILSADQWDGTADLAVLSPGVPPASPLYGIAVEQADEIVSEIELAYRVSTAPWVGVTGTNGKTTVTSLIAHLLRCAGTSAEAVGNIGTPAIDVAREASTATMIVAEVSSFQLHAVRTFHPRVAVLLNVTPDHLDWHGDMAAYTRDKARVFENMDRDDTAIVDVDDAGSRQIADALARSDVRLVRVSRSAPADGDMGLVGGMLVTNQGGRIVEICSRDELLIKGDHNVSNALAAVAAALACGADPSSIRVGLSSFEPIEHRLEPVGEVNGAEYFNDSKATNVDAVLKALTAFGDRSVVLLLGGRAKGASFDVLADVVGERTRAIVAFGEAGPEISEALSAAGVSADVASSMGDAVRRAAQLSEVGDAVLLSPACASFDEFTSYQERGHEFKRIVSQMNEEAPA